MSSNIVKATDEDNSNISRMILTMADHVKTLVQEINLPKFEDNRKCDEKYLSEYLAKVASQLFTHLPPAASSRQSLSEKCVLVVYQLLRLLETDFRISEDSFRNSLLYPEHVLSAVTAVAKGSRYFHQAVESVIRAKARLAARRRNIPNRTEDADFVLEMNFMNRFLDVDSSLSSLKEMMMMATIWQHCDMRARAREARLPLEELVAGGLLGPVEIDLAESRNLL